MKKRKLAILSIGQKPCLRENDDILTRLPEDIEIMQYGALDGLTLEEIERDYAPGPGDVLLVGGACGVGVRLGEEKIVPRLQQRIFDAEQDGADAVLLQCTGEFPHFEHHVPLILPQLILNFTAAHLADGGKIAVILPDPDQVEDGIKRWKAAGVDPIVVSSYPSMDQIDHLEQVASSLRDSGAQFICFDCMGFTQRMKTVAERASGLPVLVPSTLVSAVTAEILSSIERTRS